MASSVKRSRPHCIRYRIKAECETEAEKEALAGRLDHIRQLLTPHGMHYGMRLAGYVYSCIVLLY